MAAVLRPLEPKSVKVSTPIFQVVTVPVLSLKTMSFPAPPAIVSLPRPAIIVSLPAPALKTSAAPPPAILSLKPVPVMVPPKELAADVAAVTPKKLNTPLGKELVGSPLATVEPVPVR